MTEEAKPIQEFLFKLAEMKRIPRSGWVKRDVTLGDVESVADHSFSTCALALLLADLEARDGRRVSVERVLRLALFHDLSETLTFDISKDYLEYLGTKGNRIKREVEHSAWKQIIRGLNDPTLSRAYSGYQKEFEDERSFESRIVRAADSIDILLQVIAYTRRGYPASLFADIWKGTVKRIKSSPVASAHKLLKLLVQEHEVLRPKVVK